MSAFRIEKLSDYKFRIPREKSLGMRVDGIVYASERLMKAIREDETIKQVVNSASLPGIQVAALAMPDAHYGYGLPIGGVVATDVKEGVVTPGGVGFDINCGVRMMRTDLTWDSIKAKLTTLADGLFANVPLGVGSTGYLRLSNKEVRQVLIHGAAYIVNRGYGEQLDLEHCESGGCLPDADPNQVSNRAFKRGVEQVGTLGSGNHFVEVQVVDEIFDEKAAQVFGLFKGQITVMVHSGSRGFGHQVCTDYLALMNKAAAKYNITLRDKQLACAPVESDEGKRYMGAMRCAANYAWANRQMLMAIIKDQFPKLLNMTPNQINMVLIYDVAHNIVKIETHKIDGKNVKVAVHRKGATRAFGPGHSEVPVKYRHIGQPVLIPGDMGRASYILVGTEKAMQETFGSTCHGAGRVLSRVKAKAAARGKDLKAMMEQRGVIARAPGFAALAEEMPEAYKDIEDVIEVVHQAGLSRKVARMKPLVVLKG